MRQDIVIALLSLDLNVYWSVWGSAAQIKTAIQPPHTCIHFCLCFSHYILKKSYNRQLLNISYYVTYHKKLICICSRPLFPVVVFLCQDLNEVLISLGGENRERGSDCEGKKARPGLSVWIAYRKRVQTDETRFKRFREMDLCIICIFNSGITASLFCLNYSEKKKMDKEVTQCFEQGRNGNKCLFYSWFLLISCCLCQPVCRWWNNGLSWFLSGSPSCLVMIPSSTTTLQLHQVHWIKASIQVNQQLGLFVFLLLSSLPFSQAPSSSSLSHRLWLSRSLCPPPSLPLFWFSKVVLISGLFIIVGALTKEATVCCQFHRNDLSHHLLDIIATELCIL